MSQSRLARSGFPLRAAICAAVFVVVALTPAHAQQSSSACQLLQVSDIESALGGKVSRKPVGDRQAVSGITTDTCNVEVSRPGLDGVYVVGIIVMTGLPMDAGQAILARHTGTAREPQWKVAGAVLEQKTVGSAVCIKTGRPGVPGHSTCSIPSGKGYTEVDVQAPSVKDLVSIETVAALTQKARR